MPSWESLCKDLGRLFVHAQIDQAEEGGRPLLFSALPRCIMNECAAPKLNAKPFTGTLQPPLYSLVGWVLGEQNLDRSRADHRNGLDAKSLCSGGKVRGINFCSR